MKVKKILIRSIFICAIFFSLPFFVFSQNFNLMPPATRIVARQAQPSEDGFSITSYKFQSRRSQKEVLNFYKTLLANSGFKPMNPSRGKTKYTYYFSNEKESKVAILNFLRFVDEGTLTYHLTLHEFDPKVIANLILDEEKDLP